MLQDDLRQQRQQIIAKVARAQQLGDHASVESWKRRLAQIEKAIKQTR